MLKEANEPVVDNLTTTRREAERVSTMDRPTAKPASSDYEMVVVGGSGSDREITANNDSKKFMFNVLVESSSSSNNDDASSSTAQHRNTATKPNRRYRVAKFTVIFSLCFLGGITLALHIGVKSTNPYHRFTDDPLVSATKPRSPPINGNKAFTRYDQLSDVDIKRQTSLHPPAPPLRLVEKILDQRFPVIRVNDVEDRHLTENNDDHDERIFKFAGAGQPDDANHHDNDDDNEERDDDRQTMPEPGFVVVDDRGAHDHNVKDDDDEDYDDDDDDDDDDDKENYEDNDENHRATFDVLRADPPPLTDTIDLSNRKADSPAAAATPLVDVETIGEIFVAPVNLSQQLHWPLDDDNTRVRDRQTSSFSTLHLPTIVEADIAHEQDGAGTRGTPQKPYNREMNVDVRIRPVSSVVKIPATAASSFDLLPPSIAVTPIDRNMVDLERLRAANRTLYDSLYDFVSEERRPSPPRPPITTLHRPRNARQTPPTPVSPSMAQLTDDRFHVRESQTNGAWYMVFHQFWNKQKPNSYTLHEKRNRLGSVYGRPVIRPTLKIYFAIDRESLGDIKLKVFSLFIENGTASAAASTSAESASGKKDETTMKTDHLPADHSTTTTTTTTTTTVAGDKGDRRNDKDDLQPRSRSHGVHIVDLSYAFDRQHRINVIANTIEEAFHMWSDVLYENVQFVQIPYDGNFHNTPYNERIIVVSARHFYHRNEHTGFVETFGQSNVLAHAYYNHLHINVDKNHFYIGPHRQLDRLVYVSLMTSAKNKLQIQLIRKRQMLRLLREPSEHADQLIDRLLQKSNRLIKAGPQYNECLYCTFLHEIGHILGLGHSDNARSLMYPHAVSEFTGIDELDKLAIRKLYRRLISMAEYTEYRLLKETCDSLKVAGKKKRKPATATWTAASISSSISKPKLNYDRTNADNNNNNNNNNNGSTNDYGRNVG